MKKQIKNHPDYYITPNGIIYKHNKRIKSFINSCGYPSVKLDGNIYTISYLVANYFIPNDNCICVGYIDGDKENIKASNLFWYFNGIEENKEEVKEIKRKGNKTTIDVSPKEVVAVNHNGEEIGRYYSHTAAAKKYNVSSTTVRIKIDTKVSLKERDIYFISSEIYDSCYDIKELMKEYHPLSFIKENIIKHHYYLIDDNRHIIKTFEDYKEVMKELNISQNEISLYITGKNHPKKIPQGYTLIDDNEWKVIQDYQNAMYQAVISRPIGG